MDISILYRYVDVCWKNDHITSKWRRIDTAEVEEELKKKQNNYNVFTTIQRFKYIVHEDNEPHYCPIYFDFDSETDVNIALEDTKKVINYFYAMGIGKEHVRVWFSGKKGFHITVTPQLFDIMPNAELTYIIKIICLYLGEFLSLSSLDPVVYTSRRMWRLPDSIHQSTKLHAVELYYEDLEKGLEHIKEIAKKPRGPLYDETEYEMVLKVVELSEWFNQFLKEYNDRKDLERLKPRKPIEKPANLKDEDPVCVKHVLTEGLSKPGTRNKAEMILGAYYKDTGTTAEYAEGIITQWVRALPRDAASKTERERVADAKSVIKSVYAKDGPAYHFSCGYIRSLGATDKPIPCLYEDCPFVKAEDQETEAPIKLDLGEASRACYSGKEVEVEALVSGKDLAPFIIPERIRVKCSPNLTDEKSPCITCKISPHGGSYEFTLGPKSPHFMEFVDTSLKGIHAIIKTALRIPKACPGFYEEIIDKQNVVDVKFIPRIKLNKDNITKKMEYVERRGYFLGHDIEANKEYVITGYVLPDPKTQYVVHTFNKIKELKSKVDHFEMTDEIRKDLNKFCAEDGKIAQKIYEIHKDIENNVTKIYGRADVSIAVDLTFHSLISFIFDGTTIPRGWMNLLILGDSGQGKTWLTEAFLRHYELGDLVSGESSKRTGLLYNITETSKHWFLQWGAVPLNDRGLLAIDEFTGLSDEDFSQMTRMRESGVIEVNKVRTAKTTARTRLVFLTNTRSGKMLAEYQFGTDALLELLKHKEDIRRFDIVVTVASNEVDEGEINKRHKSEIEHVYTSDSCRTLVLWAWSRQPEDVVFSDEAIDAVLKTARYFSQNYESEIPLVEPADMRFKIARMSAALAARLFSTDEKSVKVIIKKEHVDFIKNYLDGVYSKDSMGYKLKSFYVKKSKQKSIDEQGSIIEHFLNMDDAEQLIEILSMARFIKVSDIADQWGQDVSKVRDLIKYCSKYRMLSSSPKGYVKNENFVAVLRLLQERIKKEVTVIDSFYEDIEDDKDKDELRKGHNEDE